MSVEENKAMARRYVEEVNKGNLAVVDELFAADCVLHLAGGQEIRGPEGVKQVFTMLFTAFPDYHMTVEDRVAEGDRVVTRFTFTGTHKGDLMGIAATGKQVTGTVISISRFVGGKVVETRQVADMLGLMQQIGAIPTPGQG